MKKSNVYYFDKYTELGWQVIPIKPKSKSPIFRNWNKHYEKNFAREIFLKNENFNMGLLLGEIIDIEGDNFYANEKINKLTSGLKHPTYVSNKSIHHLFANPKRLDTLRANSIEFRSFDHQSIIPPSVHTTGKNYDWLDTNNFIVPVIPDELIRLYKQLSDDKFRKNYEKLATPVCHKCKNKIKINKSRLKLETKAFQHIGLKWHCRVCRTFDLRPLCRRFKAFD